MKLEHHVCEIYDTDNTRQCSSKHLQLIQLTWERKISLTFPADTTGKFNDDNGLSLNLMWHLHSGSNLTSGTLNSSAFASATNMKSWCW